MSLDFLEYEEKVGRLWHRLVGEPASWPNFPAAAVELAPLKDALAVFFRGTGGEPGLELAAAGGRRSGHRLRLRQRLGMVEERLVRAERTDDLVLLPPRLDLLPAAELNRDLYVWLAAFLANARPPATVSDDPLRGDLARLRAAHRATTRVLGEFPGLRAVHVRLARAFLELWPNRRLPAVERRVESVARALLGAPPPDPELWAIVVEGADPAAAGLRVPKGYKPLLAVPLWGEVRSSAARSAPEGEEPDGIEPQQDRDQEDAACRRGARRECQPDERGPLTLINKGELLLLAADMVHVNRPDDDDDPAAARRAAEDMDELALGSRDRKSSSRLRLELDLDAAAVDPAPARATAVAYPEWDYRHRTYLPGHCAVLAGPAPEEGEAWLPDAAARHRIRRVQRQFEALRPKRETLRGQLDGHELDTDALVRCRVDLAAGGGGSDAVHLDARAKARDLAVVILVDASLSTDAWLEGVRVLDVEKQALTALALGIEACGDPSAILAFTSRRREVRVDVLKAFDEALDATVRRRISALRPGQYTRMGAALRHATSLLDARPERRRLLLLLSDGKPNDVDHYEGRYALEDTRKAVQEARRKGIAVFAVTVDRRAGSYVPHLFGRGGYAVVAHVGGLPDALPRIYRQVAC